MHAAKPQTTSAEQFLTVGQGRAAAARQHLQPPLGQGNGTGGRHQYLHPCKQGRSSHMRRQMHRVHCDRAALPSNQAGNAMRLQRQHLRWAVRVGAVAVQHSSQLPATTAPSCSNSRQVRQHRVATRLCLLAVKGQHRHVVTAHVALAQQAQRGALQEWLPPPQQ